MCECRTSLCPNFSTNMVMCLVAIDLFYGFWLVDRFAVARATAIH